MNRLAIVLLASVLMLHGDIMITPDGSWVHGSVFTMTPNGQYVEGESFQIAPDGSYISDHDSDSDSALPDMGLNIEGDSDDN